MAEQLDKSHFVSGKQYNPENLNLSLLIDNELFMFAIFNENYKELVELCSLNSSQSAQHTQNISEKVNFLLSNYRLAGKNFKSIHIAFLNNSFSILPDSFSSGDHNKEFLEFSSGKNPGKIFSNRFNDILFYYFVNEDLVRVLENAFKKASFQHAGNVSLNLFFNNRSIKKSDVLMNFNGKTFELLAKQNNNLLYYNVFDYETKEDILYFLLFMLEQFEIDPSKINLSIAGQVEVESEIIKDIMKYVKNVNFAVNDARPENTLEELKMPEHFYFTLLNQHSCG